MLRKAGAILYRALQIVLLGLLVYGFAQTLPFDLAILFAGDMLLYVEIATAVWLAAQATRVRAALGYARAVLPMWRRRIGQRVSRARRAARRRLGRCSGKADDRPRGALVPA